MPSNSTNGRRAAATRSARPIVMALFLVSGVSGVRAADVVPNPCRAALSSPESPRGASMSAFLKSLAPPASAWSAKSRGAVLRWTIREDGSVSDVKIRARSKSRAWDDQILARAKKWRFPAAPGCGDVQMDTAIIPHAVLGEEGNP